MKFANTVQEFKKCIILFMSGIICSVLAYTVYAVNPLNLIIEYKLKLTPDSLVFSLWRKPPIDVYVRVHIFNITNPVEFLNGEEKLKIEEVGPFVYQEILENTNATWHGDDRMSYIPRRTIVFVPEMSMDDPKKVMVNVPNIPLLGISSTLHDASFFVNFPWARLTSMLDSKPILRLSVHDYLWGYEDSLIRLASGVVPNFFNFRKFGLLDRMYDDGENVIVMNMKNNKDMVNEVGRYLSIDTFNGSPGLPQWGYTPEEGNVTYSGNTKCNRIRGATEGALLPTQLDSNAEFRVYRKAFCKPIPLVFKNRTWLDNGLEGYVYTIPDTFLETPDVNPDNACYCKNKRKCLKKGLSDMTPCYYSIPVAMSLPHFLNGDPQLVKAVEGLNPDPELHETRIIVHPAVGVPMIVNSRLQINLVMHHTTYNPKITPFNDMAIPLFWLDLNVPTLSTYLNTLLQLMYQIGPVTQTIVICVLGIGGAVCIVLSLLATLWVFNQQEQMPGFDRRDSTDLRIPLSYGQYTSIRILPAIKKITSRTDLFN